MLTILMIAQVLGFYHSRTLESRSGYDLVSNENASGPIEGFFFSAQAYPVVALARSSGDRPASRSTIFMSNFSPFATRRP